MKNVITIIGVIVVYFRSLLTFVFIKLEKRFDDSILGWIDLHKTKF